MPNDSMLTVLLFTYNHEEYIDRCITSLLNQKTTYSYEIHIWDDCSSDGTTDVCRAYENKYPDKIKLFIQSENTFLEKNFRKMQSYIAMKSLETKYFCIIDGDDYWTNENKVQMAIDFLENHDEYVGWGHDTLVCNQITGTQISHVHQGEKWDCNKNNCKIELSADSPFLLTSARIFRNCFYIQANDCLPIDYLVYYYHLSKGPVYYHDEVMSVYNIGQQSTFALMKNVPDLNSMFAYKLSLLFKFSRDNFCSAMQYKYDVIVNHIGSFRHRTLVLCKKLFGVKLGWHIWFFLIFILRYGLKCASINYVYNMKRARQIVDNRCKKYRMKNK